MGIDFVEPSADPLYFNLKYGLAEVKVMPAIAVGGFSFGTKSDVTNYNIFYGVLAKSFAPVGRFSLGYYQGNGKLLIDETGEKANTGVIATWDKALNDKGGCSAMRLKKMLGISYLTAWTMSHKIRTAMRVVPALDAHSIATFAHDTIVPGQRIKTDDYPAYSVLQGQYDHHHECVKPHEVEEKLPWVHILIGNAKNVIRGTFFGMSHKHLQRYLSEFCYRFNRRFVEPQIFDRIIGDSNFSD